MTELTASGKAVGTSGKLAAPPSVLLRWGHKSPFTTWRADSILHSIFPQFSDWKQLSPPLLYSLQVRFVGLKIQILWLLQLKNDLIKQIFSILNNELVPLETFHCIPHNECLDPSQSWSSFPETPPLLLTHWRPLSPGHLCPVRRESWSHLLPAEAATAGPLQPHLPSVWAREGH